MFKKKTKVNITEEQAQNALIANNEKAQELLNDDNKMFAFLSQLENKLNALGGIVEKLKDVPLIVDLVKAYTRKEYREIPIGTIIGLVSALVYFLSPADLIPDFIPGIGYLDDITVIGFAVKLAYKDLQDFKKWKEWKESKDIIEG